MGTLDGKVAFITGVARGQGRSHAVRLASQGAHIIGLDICADIASMDYPNASLADMAETVDLVEALGGRIVATRADVRDHAAVAAAFKAGVDVFGRCDIVIANAGIVRLAPGPDPVNEWLDIIATNLTGVWNTCQIAIPTLIDGGRGGSIIITSSTAGLKPPASSNAGSQAYTASKHALVGLMKQYAGELAKHSIRVNSIHPTGVATGMVMNEAMAAMMAANDPALSAMQNALPVQILQPEDISDAVEFLVSEQARYITGVALPVDAGFLVH